jgi:P27 family predicted phage terminase small subunit
VSAAKRPQPPKGLGDQGRALWRRIVNDVADGWELDARDLVLLTSACRLADQVHALELVVAEEGVMSKGSAGQPVPHPAAVEIRLSRVAQAQLLGKVELAPPAERTGHLNKRQRDQLRDARAKRWPKAGGS